MTIEERALALVNEICQERGEVTYGSISRTGKNIAGNEAICRTLETLAAERAEHAQFRQEVSDAVEADVSEQIKYGVEPKFRTNSVRFIIAKPDPLLHLAREMVLLDGVVRTDNQKAAIREGRAANTAADDFYDRLRTALPARGLKLVEVGDAD